MAIAPTGTDVEFMNAYIQKLSQANFQLNQKILILETQLELANKKISMMNAPNPEGFHGGEIINK